MNEIENLIGRTVELHMRELFQPFKPETEWKLGHTAVGGAPLPRGGCTTCWIIERAQETLTTLRVSSS